MMRTTNGRKSRREAGLFRRFAGAAGEALRRFAEPAPAPRPDTRELGIAGDTVSQGLPVDPYNPSLDGAEWFTKVDEMRRVGGQVTAIEMIVRLPIISTEWTVEGASQELVDLVRGNLLDDSGDTTMSTTWADVLGRACLSAIYGTWCFEKVWKEVDGALLIRRLPDRLPHSIAEYRFDADNALTGVLQKGTTTAGENVERVLPIDRLLLFPYRKEGNNWHGLSMLRGAYFHWFCLQTLYRLANIGVERSMVNTPIGKLPPNYKEADKTTFLDLLSSLRRHESGGLVLPPGYELEDGSKLGSKDTVGFLNYLEHHERALYRTALGDWLALGESARALGDVKIRFFLLAWEAFANELQAVFNRHLVRQMVWYNAPTATGDDLPRLSHTPVGQGMRLEAAAEFLAALLNGGLLVPQPADEAVFRAMLGLPEKDLTAAPTPAATDQAASDQADQVPAEAAPEAGPEAAPAADDLKQAEEPRMAMVFSDAEVQAAVDRVAADMDAAEDDWQQRGREHLAAMLTELLSQVDAATSPAELSEIAVPQDLVTSYAAWIAEWLDATHAVARQTMAEGLGRAVPDGPDPGERHLAKAFAMAEHHAEAARFEVAMAALRGETADALGARFAQQLGIRLRTELTSAAREITEQVNGLAS